MIANKRVALVGPSSSLNGQELGDEIDNHDIVIRLNRFFCFDNSQKDHGSKTNIVCKSFWDIDHSKYVGRSIDLVLMGGYLHLFQCNRNLLNYNKSKDALSELKHEQMSKLENYIENILFSSRTRRTTGIWCFVT